jgi:hypothetical protein
MDLWQAEDMRCKENAVQKLENAPEENCWSKAEKEEADGEQRNHASRR